MSPMLAPAQSMPLPFTTAFPSSHTMQVPAVVPRPASASSRRCQLPSVVEGVVALLVPLFARRFMHWKWKLCELGLHHALTASPPLTPFAEMVTTWNWGPLICVVAGRNQARTYCEAPP